MYPDSIIPTDYSDQLIVNCEIQWSPLSGRYRFWMQSYLLLAIQKTNWVHDYTGLCRNWIRAELCTLYFMYSTCISKLSSHFLAIQQTKWKCYMYILCSSFMCLFVWLNCHSWNKLMWIYLAWAFQKYCHTLVWP